MESARQIWVDLLIYIMLRFIAWQSKRDHSFSGAFITLRSVLSSCLDMLSVLAARSANALLPGSVLFAGICSDSDLAKIY